MKIKKYKKEYKRRIKIMAKKLGIVAYTFAVVYIAILSGFIARRVGSLIPIKWVRIVFIIILSLTLYLTIVLKHLYSLVTYKEKGKREKWEI